MPLNAVSTIGPQPKRPEREPVMALLRDVLKRLKEVNHNLGGVTGDVSPPSDDPEEPALYELLGSIRSVVSLLEGNSATLVRDIGGRL